MGLALIKYTFDSIYFYIKVLVVLKRFYLKCRKILVVNLIYFTKIVFNKVYEMYNNNFHRIEISYIASNFQFYLILFILVQKIYNKFPAFLECILFFIQFPECSFISILIIRRNKTVFCRNYNLIANIIYFRKDKVLRNSIQKIQINLLG